MLSPVGNIQQTCIWSGMNDINNFSIPLENIFYRDISCYLKKSKALGSAKIWVSDISIYNFYSRDDTYIAQELIIPHCGLLPSPQQA